MAALSWGRICSNCPIFFLHPKSEWNWLQDSDVGADKSGTHQLRFPTVWSLLHLLRT